MLLQLNCANQTYDWGKLGSSSAVARFAAASDPEVTISEDTPYAELWMGTHPKGPCKDLQGAGVLRDVVEKHPEVLGDKVIEKFGAGELPFLFKVLSIRKALSIQAHPDKALAKQLYAKDPKNYPDDNHKPEMAIALTDFEGFCGFRPLDQIVSFLENVPEFAELVGPAGPKFIEAIKANPSGNNRTALKDLFEAIMTAKDAEVAKLSDALVARAEKEGAKFAGPFGGIKLAQLIERLNKQFPHDIGLFCGAMLLNYVELDKGEAMFLRAKDPHAYISGDIIECMAASDNVVRSGFTPKFKDVPTLVDMLTYTTAPVEEQKMKADAFPASHGGEAKLFDPPIEEFAVLQQTTTGKSTIAGLTGPSIFVVTEGEGTVKADGKSIPYTTGQVFFVGAKTPLEIDATTKTVSYHAVCEV